jgi:hypothetical protein
MPEQRWYVTCWANATRYPDMIPAPEDEVWTVSLNPNEPGWENDSDTDGYGLTKAFAQGTCRCR